MAIALIAATILLAVGFAASNANADVTVYRGNTMEIIDTARTEPVVLRGGGSLRDRAERPAAQPAQPQIVAGNTLWLINEDSGEITACSLRNAGYAGKRRIICTRQR